MLSGRNLQMFRKNVLPPSSGLKMEAVSSSEVLVNFNLSTGRHKDRLAFFTVTAVRISYLTIFLLARYCRSFLASAIFSLSSHQESDFY